jgi:hypothetical protein
MPAPFAALEARTARAALRHAANAQATAVTRHGEVITLQVIFDNGYAAALGGLADGTQPTALCRSADVADLVQGCAFTVGGADWLVTDLQPDGTGMTLLSLRKP